MYKCQLLPVRKADQGLFSRFSAARLRTGCQLLQLSLFVAGKFNLDATHIHFQSWQKMSGVMWTCIHRAFWMPGAPKRKNQQLFQLGVHRCGLWTGVCVYQPRRRRCLIWVGPSRLIGSILWTSTALCFFLNVWILYDLVGCWWLNLDLEIQLNLVGGKVYLQKKWFYNECEVLRFFWKGGKWGRWI